VLLKPSRYQNPTTATPNRVAVLLCTYPTALHTYPMEVYVSQAPKSAPSLSDLLYLANIPPRAQQLLATNARYQRRLAHNEHLDERAFAAILPTALLPGQDPYNDVLEALLTRPLSQEALHSLFNQETLATINKRDPDALLGMLWCNKISPHVLDMLAPLPLSHDIRAFLFTSYPGEHAFQYASLPYYEPPLALKAAYRLPRGVLSDEEFALLIRDIFSAKNPTARTLATTGIKEHQSKLTRTILRDRPDVAGMLRPLTRSDVRPDEHNLPYIIRHYQKGPFADLKKEPFIYRPPSPRRPAPAPAVAAAITKVEEMLGGTAELWAIFVTLLRPTRDVTQCANTAVRLHASKTLPQKGVTRRQDAQQGEQKEPA
jgi:hypothetical protein